MQPRGDLAAVFEEPVMTAKTPAGTLKHPLLERLMHYYHFLRAREEKGNCGPVTSTQIARLVEMDATLVRKDLAAIGVRGYPRIGFKSVEVTTAIRETLGIDKTHRAVILGAGRLGSALASYRGFEHYGVDIRGLFDLSPQKAGLIVGRYGIQSMASLPMFAREQKVSIAILTVPVNAAQEVAGQAVAAGIRALWNFASTSLDVPAGICVRHEHLSVGLAEIVYRLTHARTNSMMPTARPSMEDEE